MSIGWGGVECGRVRLRAGIDGEGLSRGGAEHDLFCTPRITASKPVDGPLLVIHPKYVSRRPMCWLKFVHVVPGLLCSRLKIDSNQLILRPPGCPEIRASGDVRRGRALRH